MHWQRSYTSIDAHCEGEIGRVLTGGVPDLPGETILDKFRHLNRDGDWLRQFCVQEPRGGAEKTMNLLLRPSSPDAVAAFIPMLGDGSYSMSGSNAMCVATVLLETGMVPMTEPVTKFRLESPSGVVGVAATCRDGRCESVTVRGVPSFVHDLDAALEAEGLGTFRIDVAYGGTWYAFIDAEALGFSLTPDEARDLVDLATRPQAVHTRAGSARSPGRRKSQRRQAEGAAVLLPVAGRWPRSLQEHQHHAASPDRPVALRYRFIGPGSRSCTPTVRQSQVRPLSSGR